MEELLTPQNLLQGGSFGFLLITYYLMITRFFKQIEEMKETLGLMQQTMEAQSKLNEKLLEKILTAVK